MSKDRRIRECYQMNSSGMCSNSRKSNMTIPLERKSTSVLSFQKSCGWNSSALKRKDLKSLTYLKKTFNGSDKPTTLKSSLLLQKQYDSLKMKVKCYLNERRKTLTGNRSYHVTGTKSTHRLIKNKVQYEDSDMTAYQKTSVSSRLDKGDISGDNFRRQINIKPDNQIQQNARIKSPCIKRSFAGKIRNMIMEKSKQISDTSLKHKQKSIKLRHCSSYSTVTHYGNLDTHKSSVKDQILNNKSRKHISRRKIRLYGTHQSAPIKYEEHSCDMLRTQKYRDNGTAKIGIFKSNKLAPLSYSKNNTMSCIFSTSAMESLGTENCQQSNTKMVKNTLSLDYNQVTRKKMKLLKNRKRAFSIRIGRQTSNSNIKASSNPVKNNSKRMKAYSLTSKLKFWEDSIKEKGKVYPEINNSIQTYISNLVKLKQRNPNLGNIKINAKIQPRSGASIENLRTRVSIKNQLWHELLEASVKRETQEDKTFQDYKSLKQHPLATNESVDHLSTLSKIHFNKDKKMNKNRQANQPKNLIHLSNNDEQYSALSMDKRVRDNQHIFKFLKNEIFGDFSNSSRNINKWKPDIKNRQFQQNDTSNKSKSVASMRRKPIKDLSQTQNKIANNYKNKLSNLEKNKHIPSIKALYKNSPIKKYYSNLNKSTFSINKKKANELAVSSIEIENYKFSHNDIFLNKTSQSKLPIKTKLAEMRSNHNIKDTLIGSVYKANVLTKRKENVFELTNKTRPKTYMSKNDTAIRKKSSHGHSSKKLPDSPFVIKKYSNTIKNRQLNSTMKSKISDKITPNKVVNHHKTVSSVHKEQFNKQTRRKIYMASNDYTLKQNKYFNDGHQTVQKNGLQTFGSIEIPKKLNKTINSANKIKKGMPNTINNLSNSQYLLKKKPGSIHLNCVLIESLWSKLFGKVKFTNKFSEALNILISRKEHTNVAHTFSNLFEPQIDTTKIKEVPSKLMSKEDVKIKIDKPTSEAIEKELKIDHHIYEIMPKKDVKTKVDKQTSEIITRDANINMKIEKHPCVIIHREENITKVDKQTSGIMPREENKINIEKQIPERDSGEVTLTEDENTNFYKRNLYAKNGFRDPSSTEYHQRDSYKNCAIIARTKNYSDDVIKTNKVFIDRKGEACDAGRGIKLIVKQKYKKGDETKQQERCQPNQNHINTKSGRNENNHRVRCQPNIKGICSTSRSRVERTPLKNLLGKILKIIKKVWQENKRNNCRNGIDCGKERCLQKNKQISKKLKDEQRKKSTSNLKYIQHSKVLTKCNKPADKLPKIGKQKTLTPSGNCTSKKCCKLKGTSNNLEKDKLINSKQEKKTKKSKTYNDTTAKKNKTKASARKQSKPTRSSKENSTQKNIPKKSTKNIKNKGTCRQEIVNLFLCDNGNNRMKKKVKCRVYLSTLRKKPCFWVYYICPWFYPHCISILGSLRQITRIILLVLAFIVWCPGLIYIELCRIFLSSCCSS